MRGIMKRFLSICLLGFFCFGLAFAQTESEVQPETEDDYEYVYKTNQGGDSFIKMGLSVNLPLNPPATKLKVGGAGTLGFYRFLNSWFALGGDFSFVYSETVGSNVYYFIPLMFRTVFQLTLDKFEIPLMVGIGGSFQNYVDRMYFGLTINPEIGCFYRFRPDWSIGGMVGAYLLPQWFEETKYNFFGVITTFSVSFRYHF